MADLDQLLSALKQAEEEANHDSLHAIRLQIAESFGDSDEGVEALYKVGLDQLFRQGDMSLAVISFEAAAKKKHPYWSLAARTSLGLCYHHMGKEQKALFELRRVAFPEQPTSHSIAALTFLENIFFTNGNKGEYAKTLKARITQLEKMLTLTEGPAEQAHYRYQLALALKDQGENAEAAKLFIELKKLDKQVIGIELYKSIIEASR